MPGRAMPEGASDKSDRAVVNGAASVSAVPASVPSAEIRAILAEYDEHISPCPINNPKRGRAYAPHEKCERCGARADQNCGLDATASWHLIKALRRTVEGS